MHWTIGVEEGRGGMLVGASAEERVCVLRLMNQFDEFKFFIHNKQKQVADPN